MNYTAKTDTGKRYSHNEDFYILPDGQDASMTTFSKKIDPTDKGHLFILCDGMGGGNAGEVASQIAARWLFSDYCETREESFSSLVKKVNDKLYALSLKYEQYEGMGTTLVAALLKGKEAFFYSVGDSRGYLYRKGILQQLTEDQSEVWELYKMGVISKEAIISHPRNHIITCALGIDKSLNEANVNCVQAKLKKGDLLLLCSDGLTDMVTESKISQILKDNSTVEEKGDALIMAANTAGGKDNITVILIDV